MNIFIIAMFCVISFFIGAHFGVWLHDARLTNPHFLGAEPIKPECMDDGSNSTKKCYCDQLRLALDYLGRGDEYNNQSK